MLTKSIKKIKTFFRSIFSVSEILLCKYLLSYKKNYHDDKIAKKAGAKVMCEHRQGKGNVVRRMFADIDADVYVMIDGDATYDLQAVPDLIKTLQNEKLDMVVGARKETENACYRNGHRGGNRLLTKILVKI